LKGTLVAAQDERILSLIAQLDADDFPTREKATRELVKIRGIADALLRMTLVATESAEVRHRIETILQTPLPPVKISPEELRRMVRLVEALERSGDRSSVAFLATLGKSYPAPVIQGEALRALGRLGSE
jgi:translation elongation factor EF-G